MVKPPRAAQGVGRISLAASGATLCSTSLGFGRNLALAAAIGTGLVADSYNIANQVPNQIFTLLGGGAIAVVFVPQLMRHSRISQTRGDQYGSLLLFSGAAFGLLITVILLALSPALISLVGGSSWGAAQSALGLKFSFWCIPQIFFYSLFVVTSQLMNARGKFNAVAWAPALNSIIVIIACIPIIAVGTVQANSPGSLSAAQIVLLGGSTLLGSALQSFLILLLLRSVGFSLHIRFPVRGLGLRMTARTGMLAIAAIASYQLANLVTAALATQAGSAAKAVGYEGRGFTAFFYAQALVFVAWAVSSISLANVLLQRLSRYYEEGDRGAAARELDEAILAIGALLVPLGALCVCLGPLGAELLFTRGETDRSAARFIGVVLAILAIGLLPLALHELLIRPFYAVHDAKTPLQSAAVINVVRIAGAIFASALLPAERALLGIAAAFSLSYIVDIPLRFRSLAKRLEFKASRKVINGYRSILFAAALAAAAVGASTTYLEHRLTQQWFQQSALLLGGLVVFFVIYIPLTAQSPASLRRVMAWLRK